MQSSIQPSSAVLSFEKGYTALVWLTISCLLEKDIGAVYDVVKEQMARSSINFFGCSFGRYDLVLEFQDTSPRVASWKTIQIQKGLETIGRTEDKALGPISCSLTLCKKMKTVRRQQAGKIAKQQGTLRAYGFMKPRNYSNIREVIRLARMVDSRSDMNLFWNSSSYHLILSLSGNCFFDIFSNLMTVKQDFPELTVETCTSFVVEWSPRYGLASDIPLRASRKELIPAVTYVKLRKLSNVRLKLQTSDWIKIFNSSSYQFSRPGWLDECLFTEKETLAEILQSVNRLRQNNLSCIKATSTVPLLPLEAHRR